MSRSTRSAKKLLALFFIVLISIESLGAIIGSSDGGAFVTKQEFEELKNDFNQQIDRYNASIDNKIDGAISSYLKGINVSVKKEVRPILSGNIYTYDNRSAGNQLRYVYNPPAFTGSIRRALWSSENDTGREYGNTAMFELAVGSASHNTSVYWQTKCCVSDIDEAKRIAAWQGRRTKTYDEISIDYAHWNLEETDWGEPLAYGQLIRNNRGETYKHTNVNLLGKQLLEFYTVNTKNVFNATAFSVFYNDVKNNWGHIHNENVILFGNSKSYDCFSNMDTSRNFRYSGTSEALQQTITASTDVLVGIRPGLFNSSGTLTGTFANAHTNTNRVVDGSKKTINVEVISDPYWSTDSRRTGDRWYSGDTWLYPGIGFETSYLTNWNQLYLPSLDTLASNMVKENIKGNDKLMKDSNEKYHVPITAGLPILTVEAEQEVELPIEIYDYRLITSASATDYETEYRSIPTRTYFWAKTSPFTTNDPNSEADLEISPEGGVTKGTASGYTNGVYITSGKATLKFKKLDEACCIWLKWSTDNKVGAGCLVVPSKIILIT